MIAKQNSPTAHLKLSPEQVQAVHSTQGTLVQAAAGAGKTRVLIEHILFLIESFAQQNFKQDEEKFKEALKKYLRSIFVMTFTKKAAEEMALRLDQRLRDQEGSAPFWQYAAECIGALRISTIHSFLQNIIKRSYFLNYPFAAGDILTKPQVENYVAQNFKAWLWKARTSLDVSLAAMLARHDDQICKAFSEIFSDAQHRMQWAAAGDRKGNSSSSTTSSSSSSFLADFWPSLLSILGLEFLGEENPDLSFIEEERAAKKDWALVIQNHFQKWPLIATAKGFEDYVAMLKEFKGTRGSKKNEKGYVYFSAIINLRDKIFEYEEGLRCIMHDPSSLQQWIDAYQRAFQDLEQNYPWTLGVSYADMEYACWQGLQDPVAQKMVQQEISYLIIDELQDTSWFQWEIICLLVNHDYRKLFLVGDPQQAIYGFRGGTVAVFQEVAKVIPQKLSLAANYRSTAEVIDFNNTFFAYLFQKRFSFDEVGNTPVSFLAQTVGQTESTGATTSLSSSTSSSSPRGACLLQTIQTDERKLLAPEINQVEAHILAQQVKKLLKVVGPGEDICLLYPRLDPAKYILPLLSDVPLVAQFKIEVAEDPIRGMFYVLAQYMFERQNAQSMDLAGQTKMLTAAQDFVALMMQAYFNALEITKIWAKDDLLSFVHDSELLGIRAAVLKFFQELSLANSNYEANLQQLWPLLANLPEDWEQIALLLRPDPHEKVSFQLNLGGRQIKIMTVHAAKGLEFDHVLLGGVHTNGRHSTDEKFLGTWPSSCCWRNQRLDRKRHASPALILEKTATQRQEFSESLRLFYVAATRAKKSLTIPYLLKPVKKGFSPCTKNTPWVQGVAAWQSNCSEDFQKHFKVENFSWPILEEKSIAKIPWMQRDKLGLWAYNDFAPWAIISDLSVTRLTSLAVCPRQFYYQNICRLSDDDFNWGIKYLGDDFKLALGKPFIDFAPEEASLKDRPSVMADLLEGDDEQQTARERGTKIHQEISRWLKSLAVHTWEEQYPCGKSWQWVADFLAPDKDDYQFISEEELRFPLNGVVVNGIPDLVLYPAKFAATSKIVRIWDFKTGVGFKEHAYRAQVMAYAYGLYQLGRVKKDASIQVGLIYLDQEKVKAEEVDWPKVEQFWQALWPQLSKMEMVRDACADCRFRIFCPS